MKDCIRLYVFISTNNIYDVSETIKITERSIKEEESIRPKDKVSFLFRNNRKCLIKMKNMGTRKCFVKSYFIN
jgi:hypothetical protein